jgi:hypothetical protein
MKFDDYSPAGEAIMAECMKVQGTFVPGNPAESLRRLIDWHVTAAVAACNKNRQQITSSLRTKLALRHSPAMRNDVQFLVARLRSMSA